MQAKELVLKYVVGVGIVLCAVGSSDLARDYITAIAHGSGAVLGILVESPDDLKAGFEEGRGTEADSTAK